MEDGSLAQEIQTVPMAGSTTEPMGPGWKPSRRRLSRKRTKTGCLTCRKRRIKCDEERPTCGNCIKSKRQCEGYNQRVIFKDPLSTHRIPASATLASLSSKQERGQGPSSASRNSQPHHMQRHPQASLPSIAPRIDSLSQDEVVGVLTPLPAFTEGFSEGGDGRIHVEGNTRLRESASKNPSSDPSVELMYDTVETSFLPKSADPQIPRQQRAYSNFNNVPDQDSRTRTHNFRSLHLDLSNGSSCGTESLLQEVVYQPDVRRAFPTILTQDYPKSTEWPLLQSQYHQQSYSNYTNSGPATNTESVAVRGRDPRGQIFYQSKGPNKDTLLHKKKRSNVQDLGDSDQISPNAAYERNRTHLSTLPDFSLVDVHPGHGLYMGFQSSVDQISDKLEDEMGSDEYGNSEADCGNIQHDHLENNDLGIVVALQATQDSQDRRLRTYHSFLDGHDMLAMYEPSALNSPLSDRTTARIFCHYINVTGPSISLYERHPANPSLMFQGRPVPRPQQHIWAYTMPTLALNNQALLHAMLAIGSLHMALLQDGPITPSLKHYHISLRRVAKSVRLPMRRGQPAILAATLMLGWYELMSSDHQKWSSHLLGARQLVKEIDFAGMTRHLKNRKLQLRHARYGNLYHHDMALGIVKNSSEEISSGTEASHQDDVDENLVGMIMGKKLKYDEFGQLIEDPDETADQKTSYTQRELEIYETQRDLFWWYCKQDAFQSILSSNSLFMQYDLWSHCPPRAALGKRDATYGTYDHLILLLGRLAEFRAKDLKRKRKSIQVNGSQRRTFPGPSSQSNAAAHISQYLPGPLLPSFAGMMPGAEKKASLPRGFSPTREESPASEDEERNLEDWTAEAVEEWTEIRTAFNIIEENFGPDFQPLGPEHSPPVETPFGSALQYRTYSIAGIWITHYMGLILCYRCHPTMPPAATVAAGKAASQTEEYAKNIGRICAAIAPNASQVAQVPTGVGAGLIECTFGLFVAGVQYNISAQRSWLVQRCLDIKRLTGWQTAEAIATGCESSWVKTAEAGKGLPYTRIVGKKVDQNMWHSARRRIDHVLAERDERDKLLIARTDRVHYALGLLGVEEDFEKLDFRNDDVTTTE